MLVKLSEFFLEVNVVLLVVCSTQEVLLVAHLAVVATVELKNISEGISALNLSYKHTESEKSYYYTYIDLVELLDEGESGLEVTFEGEHLLLVFEADHCEFRCKGHVLKGLLVADLEAFDCGVEFFKTDSGHQVQIITLTVSGKTSGSGEGTHRCGHSEELRLGEHGSGACSDKSGEHSFVFDFKLL